MNFGFDIDKLLTDSLSEDIGTGDITTICTIPEGKMAYGRFVAKQDAVICGIEVCERVFKLVDKDVEFCANIKDGDKVKKGDIIATVRGCARSLLTAERTALNFLQHLSGVSTKTAKYVELVKGTGAHIADTRKTTPMFRVLEKYAVRVAGGSNHRFGLSDGVLIKDNHIVAAGGITAAVESVRKTAPHTLKIEVEVENFDQLREALDVGADIIMLDNMDDEKTQEAINIINKRALVESSGNMDTRDITKIAKMGVDIISIGALTHSITAVDISLKFSLE